MPTKRRGVRDSRRRERDLWILIGFVRINHHIISGVIVIHIEVMLMMMLLLLLLLLLMLIAIYIFVCTLMTISARCRCCSAVKVFEPSICNVSVPPCPVLSCELNISASRMSSTNSAHECMAVKQRPRVKKL